MAEIGDKLKTLRKGRKLTQDQVAERFGLTRGAISNFEINKRKPDIKLLQGFAEFYGVPLDYFGAQAPKDELFDLISRAKDQSFLVFFGVSSPVSKMSSPS